MDNPGALEGKRQQALQRLRENRGKQRLRNLSAQKPQVESTQLLLKSYPTPEQLQEQLNFSDVIPSSDEVEQLSRFAKVQEQVYQREEEAIEAVGRLKKFLQAKYDDQNSLATEASPLESSPLPTGSGKQQFLKDTLSTNFFQDAIHWLTRVDTELDFSSTPLEEVEELYQKTKYRHKVLQTMLHDTQKELDRIQLYIQNFKSFSSSNNSQ